MTGWEGIRKEKITVKNFSRPDCGRKSRSLVTRFSVHLCQRKFVNKPLRHSHHVSHPLFISPLVSKICVPCICHVGTSLVSKIYAPCISHVGTSLSSVYPSTDDGHGWSKGSEGDPPSRHPSVSFVKQILPG